MAKFKYDLHIHSCLSPCADNDMTPNSIAGMGCLNGMELMALTDHNSARNCPAFFEACARYGVIPVAGMELTTAEDIHVVCLFPTLEKALKFDNDIQEYRMRFPNDREKYGDQIIMNSEDEPLGEDEFFLPAATSLDIDTAVNMARALGGCAYPAHIDRDASGLLAMLGFFPDEPVFNSCEVHDKSKAYLAENRRVIVSSDAHRLEDMPEAENEIELDIEEGSDENVVREALINLINGAM